LKASKVLSKPGPQPEGGNRAIATAPKI